MSMKNNFLLLLVLILAGFKFVTDKEGGKILIKNNNPHIEQVSLIILGTIQDGGSPHIGCKKDCCKKCLYRIKYKL